MNVSTIAAALAAAGLLAGATAATAEDVEAGGHALCTLTLGAAHTVKAPATCGDALSASPTGWQATRDGMQLTANGQPVLAFHRWSNSLFVSHRASGVDIQLRRGAPGHIGQGLPG